MRPPLLGRGSQEAEVGREVRLGLQGAAAAADGIHRLVPLRRAEACEAFLESNS